MFGNFAVCLPLVLTEEGGFSDDPRDPGGATNHGVTMDTLSRWLHHPASVQNVRDLTVEGAAPIYKHWYWDALHCDALPEGVDLMVFDAGVNMGLTRSALFLQTALGEGVAIDGHIGPLTIEAATHERPAALIADLAALRERRYRELGGFPTYGKGWLARLKRIKTAAGAMAAGVI